ncbi:MAG: HipA N-terminal domain-containing protein [Halothiobacillaceae bacterium]
MLIQSTDELAGYFRDRRKNRALTQVAVAEDARLRQGTVSAFERSPDSTRLDTVFRLLAALDLELHVAPKESPGARTAGVTGESKVGQSHGDLAQPRRLDEWVRGRSSDKRCCRRDVVCLCRCLDRPRWFPLHLPVDAAAASAYREDVVYNFFDNLLPDSRPIRDRVQARFGVSSFHPFDLLEAIVRALGPSLRCAFPVLRDWAFFLFRFGLAIFALRSDERWDALIMPI